MEIKIKNSFNRSTKKIKDKSILKEIDCIVEDIKRAETIGEIKGIKSLAGKKHFYRIKTKGLKNYRIILKNEIESIVVELLLCIKRQNNYREIRGLSGAIKICKKCGEKFTPERINIVNCKNCR